MDTVVQVRGDTARPQHHERQPFSPFDVPRDLRVARFRGIQFRRKWASEHRWSLGPESKASQS